MIHAFVFIEAEPGRIEDLVHELGGMRLRQSLIRQIHAVTGRYDLIALVESPDLAALGD
jgi:hypothetical protein